ncbi:hypothetical protein [Niabella hirudinis]|uniref:hypothetical protein n=1 Tax=Niabella hirudinis TaxID=1285929 RepID=UPI003EB73454
MQFLRTTDPFHTESWCLEATTNPYRVFALCFYHAGDIHEFRKWLLHLFLFIEQFEGQTQIPPFKLCCAFMAIGSVIDAAHYIYTNDLEPDQQADLSILADEALPGQKKFASYFIEKEQGNIRKVIEQFFAYQTCDEWKSSMHMALYHGVTDRALGVEMDEFSVWFYLMKLLEAAYIQSRGVDIYA